MTGRNYDFILTVNNSSNFQSANLVIGSETKTTALVVNVDHSASTIKVKLSNVLQEFKIGETIYSNVSTYNVGNGFVSYNNTTPTVVSGNSFIINGSTNTFAVPNNVSVAGIMKQNITVYQNGRLLPDIFWVYPSTNTLGAQGITIKPLVFNPTTSNGLDEAGFFPGLTGLLNTHPQVVGATQIIRDSVETIYEEISIGDGSYTTLGYQITRPEIVTQDLYAYIAPPDLINLANSVATPGDAIYVLQMPTYNTNSLTISITASNLESNIYTPSFKISEHTTAFANVTAVANSPFIREKNAFEQQPLVRLYTIYYPGELYPANEYGNPDDEFSETPWPWPVGFPYRFAEVRGDIISDLDYRVRHDGLDYTPYPINSSGIQMDSSGKINDLTVVMSNFDNLITQIVEDSYLFGYNSSNNAPGIVNGQLVFNIDPRTNPSNVHYDENTAISRGGNNIAFDYDTTIGLGDTWVNLKHDSRDLLGAIIEIRTTFANFLDAWPEYSSIIGGGASRFQVRTSSPYRVGDIIHNNIDDMDNASCQITQIVSNYLVTNNAPTFSIGDNLYIKNPEASPDDYILDTFKVNALEALDEVSAKFSLTSWLQYFKLQIPKRKYFRNTCPFIYKSAECGYPASGSGAIHGTVKVANGFFNIKNETVLTSALDVCAKNDTACTLRNNEIHFGAFVASGTALPR